MAEKEISLLKEQILRLEEKNFDLDAWKKHTRIYLERIFGKDSSKIKMLGELNYDYSSWSLRDTAASGKTKDKDPVRMQAREIIEASIIELETLGLPEKIKEKEKLWELLQDELTGRQIKEIETLLKSEDKEKENKIGDVLETLDKENLVSIISRLLIS